MKGKTFSHMIGTLSVITDTVPLKHVVNVVDDKHVSLLTVSRLDGSPMFGRVCPEDVLDLESISRIKIPDVDLSIDIEGEESGSYTLTLNGEGHEIRFKAGVDIENRDPKVPALESEPVTDFDPSALMDLISSMDVDRTTIWADGKTLKATVTDDFNTRTSTIGTVDTYHDGVWTCLPSDYLKKMLKRIPKKGAILYLDTSYPIKIEWTDTEFSYNYLLAPRIETDDKGDYVVPKFVKNGRTRSDGWGK